MKRFFLLITMFLALSSCQKQNLVENQDLITIENELLAQDQNFVSKDKASEVAGLFFSSNSTTKGATKSVATIDAINDENYTPLMYVINYVNGGFIVISATKEYNPVLAFSEESTFSTQNIQSGVTLWMDEKKFDITEVKKGAIDSIAIKNIAMEWARYEMPSLATKTLANATKSSSDPYQAMSNRIHYYYDMPDNTYLFYNINDASQVIPGFEVSYYENRAQVMKSPIQYAIVGVRDVSNQSIVGPLMSTSWNQYNTFNDLCPNQWPAGCVAIAMAQIMKYHQWPTRYNWNSMPDDIGVYETQRLIADIGSAVDMNYQPVASSSTIDKAKNAFQNTFGYDAAKENYSINKAITEITVHRLPIYMRGQSDPLTSGHAWVCDGFWHRGYNTEFFVEFYMPGGYMAVDGWYDNPRTVSGPYSEYFYMNWGWGGSCNGWFYENNVSTDLGNFVYDRKCLYVSKK